MAQQEISIQSDLSVFIQQKEATPFLWGFNDCCLFAADWVALRTGVDVIADLRGIHDAKTALRKLEYLGGLEAAVTARLGLPIAAKLSSPGAVVLLESPQGQVLGVNFGDRVGVVGDFGLMYVSIELGVVAWPVS